MHCLYKTKLQEFSHFFLACLIFMMNVNGNNFFHLKELFFIMFISTSLQYGDYRKLWNFILMMILYLFSATANLISESSYRFSAAVYNLLGFIYLFLQVYETPEYTRTIVRSFLFSAKVVAWMSVAIWILCMASPPVAAGLTFFFEMNKTDAAAFIFMIVQREILGFPFLRVYYCTAPCMICALGYCLVVRFYSLKDENWFSVLLFSFGLLISGARANILAVVLLNGAYICLKLIQQKKLARAFMIILAAGTASFVFLLMMLNEKSDSSIKVKTLHKISYMELFDMHPYKTIFTGWGAGSEFYSKGFRKMTDTTELSFYETIRRYGIISTVMIFIFIWGRPVIFVLANRMPLVQKLFFSVMVISYIAVACTNPFLLGSIGFCSLIFIETVIYDFYRNKNLLRLEKKECAHVPSR